MGEVSVSVKNLNLEYRVYQYATTSFKEYVMNKVKGRSGFQLIKALSDVNFAIEKGESVALIGHNGSGKSTLLKCIAGIYQPEGAEVTVVGRTAPMIELGAGFDFELSGRENIRLSCMLMGLSNAEIDARTESIIDFSEIREFIDIPFKNYSSGMQTRLGFACATAVDPDILLVDEVLAVGDSNFAKKCLARVNYLKAHGTTVVLVSHDFATIRNFCSRGIVLDKGVVQFDGPINGALACQEKIMDGRYLENLRPEERAEGLRLLELAKDSTTSNTSSIPFLTVLGAILQDGVTVETVDVNRSFTLKFQVAVQKSDCFEGDISLGFGLNCSSGVRVGGTNNLKRGVQILKADLMKHQTVECTFVFEKGIPNLSSGEYKIYCGVHDRGIRRSIFFGEVFSLVAQNKNAPVNLDGDIIDLNEIVTDLTMKFLNET